MFTCVCKGAHRYTHICTHTYANALTHMYIKHIYVYMQEVREGQRWKETLN